MNIKVCAVLVFVCVTVVTARYTKDRKVLTKWMEDPIAATGDGGPKGDDCKQFKQLGKKMDRLIELLEYIVPDQEGEESGYTTGAATDTPTTDSQTTTAEATTNAPTTSEPEGTTAGDLKRQVLISLLRELEKERSQIRH